MSAVESAVSPRPRLSWDLRLSIALCGLLVMQALLQSWLQQPVLDALLELGGAGPVLALAKFAPVLIAAAAWALGIRLYFRRSRRLAQWLVACVILLSGLPVPWLYAEPEWELALHLLWLIALGLLFMALRRNPAQPSA